MSGPAPGTLDGVHPEGQNIENNGDFGYDGTEEEDEEKQFLNPSRWWFASTACPLIAGTFAPMASSFNICALGSYWRETVSKKQPISDPSWLLAVNAISLGFAIVANISLLANMAGRARFETAQTISIVGFFAASVLLIAIVAKTSQTSFVGASGHYALTQAYYYAIWAAGIYFIVTLIMLLTVYGAVRGKYEKKFDLTVPQRTLMLQTIAFLVYLLIGALIFSSLEHWKYLDAVFWATFTLLTVGLGSPFTPMTHAGRSILFFYAVGGIVTLGLVVGSIRSMLVETGKSKLRARATEKTRRKVHSYRDAPRGRLAGLLPSKDKNANPSTERDRRRLEFHGMRHIQDSSSQRSQWNSLVLSTLAAGTLWLIGALIFMQTESQQGWSYFVALYFSYTSLLTIGYGDFQPYSNSGRAFYVLWSLLAVPTLTVLISDMSDTVVKVIAELTNWLGSLTILPERNGLFSSWREAVNKFSGRKWIQPKGESIGSSGAALGTAKRYDQDEAKRHGNVTRMLRTRLTEDDIFACQQYCDNSSGGASGAHDVHFYRWLLINEIKNVLADNGASEARKYTYEEWAYFLLLMGHDEANPRIHRRPNASSDSGVKSGEGPILGQIMDPDGNPYSWSWMGIRSPLMSPKDEAAWILHHLVLTLQRQLSLEKVLDAEKQDLTADLPVSMAMMQAMNVDGALAEIAGSEEKRNEVV